MNAIASNLGGSHRFATALDTREAVLLIGYGNLLRSDDGVGPAIVSGIAARFESHPPASPCRCLVVHQLTPELADDIHRAQRVIFVDASTKLKAGHVEIRRLPRQTAAITSPSLLAHHISPQSLLALSQSLYNESPRAWTVAIGIANTALGDRLSPPVCLAVARLSHLLAHRIRRWTGSSASPHASKDHSHV